MTKKAAKRGQTINPLFTSFEGLPESSTSSLYLASTINGVSKVGTTTRPFDRLKALQRDFIEKAGGPIEYFSFFEAAGDQREEKALLVAMAAAFPLHCGREFFACDYASAFTIVIKVIEQVKQKSVARQIRHLETIVDSYNQQISETHNKIGRLRKLGDLSLHATFSFGPSYIPQVPKEAP